MSTLVDQEVGHQVENHNLSSDDLHRTYTVDEFEVRILEPEKSGGPWQTKATIPMQTSENALTVRVVTLFVSLYLAILAHALCLYLLSVFFCPQPFLSPIFGRKREGMGVSSME